MHALASEAQKYTQVMRSINYAMQVTVNTSVGGGGNLALKSDRDQPRSKLRWVSAPCLQFLHSLGLDELLRDLDSLGMSASVHSR